jgi:hypothetical protein
MYESSLSYTFTEDRVCLNIFSFSNKKKSELIEIAKNIIFATKRRYDLKNITI